MKQLENKVAVITGAGSGIGAATAQLFVAEGAKVVLSDINESSCRQLAQQLSDAGAAAYAVKADVSDPLQCEALVAATMARYGRLDIAFNNAGIGGESNAVGDMSVAGWNKVIAVNLNSVFYCMKYELEAMAKNGGSIVNMASILGQVGFGGAAGYVAAKHGVVGLTQTAAIEYGPKGIRINVIGPGFIDTPLLSAAGMDEAAKQQVASQHPIGRLGKAEEVAELVLWLSTNKASFVTGAYYAVDGGYLSR